jgi:molecular chaperone GrpE
MTDTEQAIEQAEEPGAGPSAPVHGGAQTPDGARQHAGVPHAGASHPSAPRDAGADEAALMEDVAELADLAAQRDEYLALAQRTQADFENYRKRVARESAMALSRGVAKLAKELFGALDSLDRALGEAAAGESEDALVEGVRLVRSELLAALARVGIEPFSPTGEPFDPAMHEAMAQQPVEGAESGTVAQVFQPGYRMGDEILRAAKVLVAA